MDKVTGNMTELMARLYPICRSITGDGVRQTLRILKEQIPLTIREVPTGTRVFDWTVPPEWNIRDAWIKNAMGERLVDFRQLNLHVVSYSIPVHRRMPLAELRPHLFTVPGHPEWIPYRTSYYDHTWGFCLSEKQLAQFTEGEEYEVCIDSTPRDGQLTYGDCLLQGEQPDEVLISCHICHPSLANDNLSGITIAVELARQLRLRRLRYSYRFVFVPGSIGAITWLAQNQDAVSRIRHGLVLACVGDSAPLTYKRSRRGDAEIDRAFAHVLEHSGAPHRVIDFLPYGFDERQYCSPGFDLPVGCLMRSLPGSFPEYHTSADNLAFVQPEALAGSLTTCLHAIQILEDNRLYLNTSPQCEPQLGRRGLYEGLQAGKNQRERELALLWVLNLSDGRHSLLDIAQRARLPFSAVRAAAQSLAATDLLRVREDATAPPVTQRLSSC